MTLAVDNLITLLADPTTPPTVRAQAARTLLEAEGVLGAGRTPLKSDTSPASELSPEELEAEIAALEGDRKGDQKGKPSVKP